MATRGNRANLTNAGKGRPKGSLNKATADIKALARVHAPVAMKELARLAVSSESDAARVAAIKELFDRGFGKATQPIAGDPDMPALNIGAAPDAVVAWLAAQTFGDDAETAH
jgi:hypothetical protein